MPRKIIVFGHGDTSERGFARESDFVQFIRSGIFDRQAGRYRISRRLSADVVVLSRKGVAYGHFEIVGSDEANENDRSEYPKVGHVLLVSHSILYERPFNLLRKLGIRITQAAKKIDEKTFGLIQAEGNGGRVFGDPMIPEEVPSMTYMEGSVKRILVNRWERDRDAVAECKRILGTRCSVCELDLGAVYGEIGDGYIHVHHLIPGSERKTEYAIDPGQDLRPVCPNCHAMIHRNQPPFTIEQMRQRIHDWAVKSKSRGLASVATA